MKAGGTVVTSLPASAGDAGDLGSIPGWGDSLEEEKATHSSMLAWRIPWTEERGRLQSLGPQSWTRLSKHSEGTMGSEKDGEEG